MSLTSLGTAKGAKLLNVVQLRYVDVSRDHVKNAIADIKTKQMREIIERG